MSDTPKISAIALVPVFASDAFHGIDCVKGRGIILPGGKWEPGESYHDTALRELREELGIDVPRCEYLWHGPDCDGYTCFAFFVFNMTGKPYKPLDTGSGTPTIATWDDLIDSHYGAYYKVLLEVCLWHPLFRR